MNKALKLLYVFALFMGKKIEKINQQWIERKESEVSIPNLSNLLERSNDRKKERNPCHPLLASSNQHPFKELPFVVIAFFWTYYE